MFLRDFFEIQVLGNFLEKKFFFLFKYQEYNTKTTISEKKKCFSEIKGFLCFTKKSSTVKNGEFCDVHDAKAKQMFWTWAMKQNCKADEVNEYVF